MKKEIYKQVLGPLLVVLMVFVIGFNLGEDKTEREMLELGDPEGGERRVDMAAFWKAWQILEDKFTPLSSTTPPVTSQEKVWGAIEGLAAAYKDPYTIFFPPVESKIFEEEISGSFGGVGMEIGVQDGVLSVVAPLKNTPAERAGVKAGDKIIAINNEPALKMSTEEAIKKIRGEVGTVVTITFAREGVNGPLVKEITRAVIAIPTVSTRLAPEGVFVIELYNFSANSPNLFREALRAFVESGSDKLVLDLRNNPGGFLEAALDMGSWFLPTGKIVVTEDFGGDREDREYRSKGYDVFTDRLKMAILINGGTASASEILAGALRQYGKAVLIGEKTFGKGSVQELLPVTDDTSLKVTVAHWLLPNGVSISEGGLLPDIEVKKEESAEDLQLQAAIKYLNI